MACSTLTLEDVGISFTFWKSEAWAVPPSLSLSGCEGAWSGPGVLTDHSGSRGSGRLWPCCSWCEQSPDFLTGACRLAARRPSSASSSLHVTLANFFGWHDWGCYRRECSSSLLSVHTIPNRSPSLCRKRTGRWVGFPFVVHSCLLWRTMAFPRVRSTFGPGLRAQGPPSCTLSNALLSKDWAVGAEWGFLNETMNGVSFEASFRIREKGMCS